MLEAHFPVQPLRHVRALAEPASPQAPASFLESSRQPLGRSGHYLMLLRQRYAVRRGDWARQFDLNEPQWV